MQFVYFENFYKYLLVPFIEEIVEICYAHVRCLSFDKHNYSNLFAEIVMENVVACRFRFLVPVSWYCTITDLYISRLPLVECF